MEPRGRATARGESIASRELGVKDCSRGICASQMLFVASPDAGVGETVRAGIALASDLLSVMSPFANAARRVWVPGSRGHCLQVE